MSTKDNISFTEEGKSIAFLYENYGKKLYGYAVSKWKMTEDEAWELVYKTLYRFNEVANQYTFENEAKRGGFIFKIFINYLRNFYRDNKDKKMKTVELKDVHGKILQHPNLGEKKRSNPLLNCLKKALQALQDWQRVLLLMRAQDFSYEQISPYVEKTSDQLKVYHMRLKKLVTDNTNECMSEQENG